MASKLAPVSFGIVDDGGNHFFVTAHDFGVDDEGRLVFWRRHWLILRRTVSVWEVGMWRRVLRDVEWEDVARPEE